MNKEFMDSSAVVSEMFSNDASAGDSGENLFAMAKGVKSQYFNGDNRRGRNSVILPKATAMWLIDNTALTFQQIANFCNLHILEVVAMANGEHPSIKALSPIQNGQLMQEEIDHCTTNPDADLTICDNNFDFFFNKKKNKASGYVSRRRRRDKPDAILWLLKNHPEFEVGDICKLINTTKNVIFSIQDGSHWNYSNLEAKNPVELELCAQDEINNIKIKKEIVKARDAQNAF